MAENVETPKPKRQMTPEVRQRMLDNLAKGRAAKLLKLKQKKEQDILITKNKNEEEKREIDETPLAKDTAPLEKTLDQKLTCPGCRKVFKHSSSKSKHVKKCKFIATNNVVEKPEPKTEPVWKEPKVEEKVEEKVAPETDYEIETIPPRRRKRRNHKG